MLKKTSFRTIVVIVMVLALTSISCGVASLPFLATETPTPTITFTPSPTITPSPTATETPVPSATSTPLPTGVTAEEQADGTTIFVDYDNGYQMTLPKDWIVIPLSSDDLVTILNGLSKKNPELKDVAESFKQLDPDVIRVIAMNADSKYTYKGFATNLTITALEDKLMSTMPLEFVTGALEESLKQQGTELLSDNEPVITNSNGVEIVSIDFKQKTPTSTGATVTARSKVLIFQTGGKIIMIQLSVPQQFGEELLPVLDQISASVKLIK